MSVIDSKLLNREHIKVRWKEPYISHALNRKDLGNTPRGIYSGFNIIPIGHRTYQVNGTIDPLNFQGSPETYNHGAYNSVSGYSIAVFSDNLGHAPTVVIPPGAVSGTFDLDLTGSDGQKRIVALDVDYLIGNQTVGTVLAVDSTEMTNNPDYLVLGVINVPSVGAASLSDIDYNDSEFPRTLPMASRYKYGYMSPQQALILETIGTESDSIYCSNNDADVWWRIFGVSGGGIGRLDFSGSITLNYPTSNYNITVTNADDVVSGITNGDVLYFTYPTDGSVSGATLQIAHNNTLPIPPAGEQLSIFGMRCGNDFWFKNGQKWEVGEKKPFGVTSKTPDLTVGETGNPPVSHSVSGIYFDNAQVTVLPGGRDVTIFFNVSGSVPNVPLEEHFLVTNPFGEDTFTTSHDDFYWINDNRKTDIHVFLNGAKLTQFNETTSGITYSDGSPIWNWKKIGTRTIQLRRDVYPNAMVTIRHEADRGIQAKEQSFLVSAIGGEDTFTSIYPFNPDNDVPDISLYRNGQKVEYADLPLNPLIHGATKISALQVQFGSLLPRDSVVTIRHESTCYSIGTSGSGGGGGDYWSDPVNSDIEPLTDNLYSLGVGKRFKNGNFAGDVAMGGDAYIGGKLSVSGGIDPTYLQLTPINPAIVIVPNSSLFVDGTAGNALKFKNDLGIDEDITGGTTSGINIDEDETMYNPYPFAIEGPKAVSLSTSGSIFYLTDYQQSTSIKNFFGILTTNVSGFGSGEEDGIVKWRGKLALPGYNNGAVYVSGNGELVQSSPSVSGVGILQVGVVKNQVLFIRPTEGFIL